MRKVIVNNIPVDTETQVCTSANILEVEVGTTGYRGGDSGHGGRTYIRLKDLSSTDMQVRVNGGAKTDLTGGQIEIAFGGDSELETFISALQFALNTLEKQSM